MSGPGAHEANPGPRAELRRFLVRGGALAAIGRFATLAAALAVHGLIARLLTPHDVGRFFLLYSIVLVARTLGGLGLGRTVVRRLGEADGTADPGRARQVIGTALGLAAGGGLAVATLLAAGPGGTLLAALGGRADPETLWLAALWALALALEGVVAEAFRGLRRIAAAVGFNGLLSSLLLALFLVCWSAAHGAGWQAGLSEIVGTAAVAAGLSCAVGLAILARTVRLRSEPIRSPAPGSGWAAILVPSLPILASTLIAMLLEALGLWILGAVGAEQTQLALFGTAQRLARLVGAPVLVANAVLLPVVARLHAAGDRSTLTAVMRLSATLTGGIALIATILLVVAGGPLMGLVFGPFYEQAAPLLALLSLGQLVFAWSGSCGVMLLMSGQQGAHLKVNLLSLGALVAGGILLAGSIDAFGMAIAVVAAVVIQQVTCMVAAHRRSGVWTGASLSPRRLRNYWLRLADDGASDPDGKL